MLKHCKQELLAVKKFLGGWGIVIALSPVIGCNAAPQVRTNSLEAELDVLVPKLLKEQSVAGVSIAVVQGGKIILARGYGLSNKNRGTPVKLETRFQVGSLSKTLTAWGVMKLVERGLIELDAPIDRYLKRWHLPKSDFDNNKVTVRRLLSHTSGLSVYPASASINLYIPGEKMPSLEESLSRSWGRYGTLRVVAEPNTHFEYNNGNYIVLQLMIEDVTGKPFADYMQETLFKPLGMSNTGYEWTSELQSVVATPYGPNGEAWAHYQGVGQGSGGAYTTASDLARFAAAAMPEAKGSAVGRGVLKGETVRQMLVPSDNTNGSYGFGYKMFPVSKEVQLISHDGANEGWRAMFLMHPQKGEGIVILTNSDIGGKIIGPIVCAWSERTTIDMSPLCKSVSR